MVGCVLKFLLSLLGLSCRAPIKIQFEAKELEPIILQVYFLDCQHYLWHINIINVNGNLQCLLWGSGICYLKWDSLPQKGIKRQRFLTRRNWTTVAKAVAIPVAPSSPDNAEYRQQLSESYGFKQIGEPLPDNVTLKHVIDTLPKKVLFSFSEPHRQCYLFLLFEFVSDASVFYCWQFSWGSEFELIIVCSIE